MERSKNVALMFLLGALLVGGALGFSADRLMVRDQLCPKWGDQRGMRTRLNDELGLSVAQRAAVDSILDERNRQMTGLLKPIRSQMDSIKDGARAQITRLLDERQRARFEAMHAEMLRNAKESEKR